MEVSVKNYFKNVNGLSSNQLVFGKIPNFPSACTDSLPTLENKRNCGRNLNALYSARNNFTKCESSSKLLHTLKHLMQTFSDLCSCHVTYAFQSESTLYICLNVKELLA